MTVKELASKKFYKEFSIEIPYQQVNQTMDDKIKAILPTVELPGFRKGKAPLNIVKKKYENNILGEVIENLAKENIKKIIKEKNLKILRQPKVEVTKYAKDNPLELKFKIDLDPSITLVDFAKLKTTKYNVDIDKKTYDENYNQYIKSQITYNKIDNNRSIQKGDRLTVDISSEDEIVPDFLKNQNDVPIYTDNDFQILPNISEKLIQQKTKMGDKIELSFDLKEILKVNNSKLAKFVINIKSVEEKKEVKIDNEFLKKNNMKSESDLKNKVKENLQNYYQSLAKEIEKKQLYDLMESKHEFEVPEGIFEEEFNQIWQRVEKAKKDNSLDEDDKQLSDSKLKKRYESISIRRVKLAILIQKIAEKNSINVTNEELTNGLLQYASRYPGQEKEIFDFFKKNPSQMETIRGPIFENKVLDDLLTKTIKENKNISVKDFLKLQKETFSVGE